MPSRLQSIRRLFFWISVAIGVCALAAYLIPSSRDVLIPVLGRNDRWGYINASGRVMIEPVWGDVRDFDAHGLARVTDGRKWGWIDKYGEVAIPLQFDEVEDFDDQGMARIVTEERIGWIDLAGDFVIDPDLKWAHGDFDTEGVTCAAKEKDGETKFGWIDRNGNEVIPFEWDDATPFGENGLALVARGKDFPKKFGILSRSGEIVLEPKLDFFHAEQFDREGMAAVYNVWNDIECGWINEAGELVIPLKWNRSHWDFDSEGMVAVVGKGAWGWINRRGDIVIPLQWDHVERFNDHGLAPVYRERKGSLINRSGEVVFTYPGMIRAFDTNDRARVIGQEKLKATVFGLGSSVPWQEIYYKFSGLDGWIDSKGELVIDLRGGVWLPPRYWGDGEWEINPLFGGVRKLETGIRYGHYVAARPYKPSKLRSYLDRFSAWLGIASKNSGPIPECRCYHKDGKLIWSSTWVRFETKCLIVLGISLFLAFIFRPRLGRRRRKKDRAA